MIQLVVNTTLLRELDERKLINAYARFVYNDENDTSNDNFIKENLIQLLDWDENGDNGLGLYCSKFESLKEKDWQKLIQFIKENHHEIKSLASQPMKIRKLESIKVVNSELEKRQQHKIERLADKNYQVSGRGKKAKPCIYEGREYKSRNECVVKEGLTYDKLYKYLRETNQV